MSISNGKTAEYRFMERLRAYYSVLKPERTLANILTTAAGFLFACAWQIDWVLFVATLLGTSLVVASACAVNNVTDRAIDAQMPRTNQRAIVVGTIPSRNVSILAVCLGLAGFGLLATYVNRLTVAVGLVGYVDYVVLYAWSKRRTVHSTLIGTISGSAPLVAGYTAVTGQLDVTALLLAFSMLCWQMAHFFAIGIYRREHYAAAHLPIMSVVRGQVATSRQMLGYILGFIVSVCLLFTDDKLAPYFFVVMLPLSFWWLWGAFGETTAVSYEKWGARMFGNSLIVLLVFCAVLAGGSIHP